MLNVLKQLLITWAEKWLQTLIHVKSPVLRIFSILLNLYLNCRQMMKTKHFLGMYFNCIRYVLIPKGICFTPSRLYMYLASPNVMVHEEYLLFDFNSIIASVGGSMGLFLSFSFLECLLISYDIIQKLLCSITKSPK